MVKSSPPVPPSVKLRVAFVLAPRFTLTAFAGFVDALRLAADEGDRSRRIWCDWRVLSHNREPILSSCGAAVQPQLDYEEALRSGAFDHIVVVGGLLHGGQHEPAGMTRFLQQAAQGQTQLVGLCTGSFILARAGLMSGYLACVSWFHRDEFVHEFPQVRVTSNQMFVVDRDRLTCAGGTSVVHLAAHLIEKRIGRAQAVKALRVMLEDLPLPSRTLQPEQVVSQTSRDPVVHKVLLLIEQHLTTPGPVSLAFQFTGLSERQLERRFVRDIGMTPAQYRQMLRLQRAEQLLRHGELSIQEVALESGFQDASQFARSIKARYGQSPTALRAQLRAPASAGSA